MPLTHLDKLEARVVYTFHEVVVECERPVMLYSIDRDSSAMLHLTMKIFYFEKPPFPLLHIDTSWKFHEMVEFHDCRAKELGISMLVYRNEEAIAEGVNPFGYGTAYTDIMKAQALKETLTRYRFTIAFSGGWRNEEKSRAKERISSFRNGHHAQDPKSQCPEMQKLYNTRINKGESIRVFPVSSWTEKGTWQYIRQENIEIVSLYFAAERPVAYRDGNIIMANDDRVRLLSGERPQMKKVRFRTLSYYPFTGGIESDADMLDQVIAEILSTVTSERTNRVIDKEAGGSVGRRKQEGYF